MAQLLKFSPAQKKVKERKYFNLWADRKDGQQPSPRCRESAEWVLTVKGDVEHVFGFDEVDVVVEDLDALLVVKHRLRGLVFATKALARLFYNLLQGRPVLLAEVNIALHLRLVYASVHTDDDLAKNTHKIVWLPSSSLLLCLSRLNLTLLLFSTGSITWRPISCVLNDPSSSFKAQFDYEQFCTLCCLYPRHPSAESLHHFLPLSRPRFLSKSFNTFIWACESW